MVAGEASNLVLGCRLDLSFLEIFSISPRTVPTRVPYVESLKETIGEFLVEFH
jgi:hypothetical protein